MMVKAGIVLKSTSKLANDIFAGANIVLVEYNEAGAVGFILNKPFYRSLNELAEYRHLPAFPIFDGGPVNHEHLYFIHQRPDLIEEGVFIKENLYWGGRFDQVVQGIEKGTLQKKDVKIFIGYCGWDKGDLEAEIEENSWVIDDESSAIFS